jgi:meso-butanediol dehydrogenase/(S,S)-butanediol dehydrogenase/diacetyl reductase
MGLLDGTVALISGTDGAEETVQLVQGAGGEMRSMHPCDLTDPQAAENWVKTGHDAWGGFDILYNNAGPLRIYGPFAESTLEDWDENLRYELTLVYSVSHSAWPYLIGRGGGVILNVASGVAYRGTFPSRSAGCGAHSGTRPPAVSGCPIQTTK